jgi:hypothetical protein
MNLLRKILLGEPPCHPAFLMVIAEALAIITLALAFLPSR